LATHKPLDRQLADERARHPTTREATRAGARFGFFLGLIVVSLAVVDLLVPGQFASSFGPPARWPRLVASAAAGLAAYVLVGATVAGLGAVVVRWQRRLAARVWFPDRAA
jgi:hypothetical protein